MGINLNNKSYNFDGKIAIFSDIHGNYQALTAILDDLKEREIKNIICLGDNMSLGPNPKECLNLIIDNNIPMTLGNHELYYLKGTNNVKVQKEGEKHHHSYISECSNIKHKIFLESCPMRITCNVGKIKVYFQHFIFNPNKDDIYPFDELSIIKNGLIYDRLDSLDCDLLFLGHEHYPFTINHNNKKLICIGSSGCLEDDNTFYTILDPNNLTINKINLKYDREEFERIINNLDNPKEHNVYRKFFGMSKKK